MTVLSLCDFTGIWSAPYEEAGYLVTRVDLRCGRDVRLLEMPSGRVQGIIAQPPCTHLAGSGARWWAEKGDAALLDGLSVVDACLRFVAVLQPAWWVLENPVGRLSRYLGPPAASFDPCDYAGYADDPAGDAYTKRTCLWGRFTMPRPRPVEATLGSKMHRLPPSEDRGALRSVTPQGWARAFFEANP